MEFIPVSEPIRAVPVSDVILFCESLRAKVQTMETAMAMKGYDRSSIRLIQDEITQELSNLLHY